ncbi:MAG: tetratricopeptide repeat protein [Microbacter sp.]
MKIKLLGLFLLIIPVMNISAQINTDRVMAIGQNALYFQDYVLAIQYFNQVIAAKPYLPEPYFYRAIAKIQLEDFLGAEADCSSALQLNPFMPGVYYARAYARVKLNDLSGAESDITKAMKYNPDNSDLLRIRIWVYELEKKYDQALADINTLIQKNKGKEDSQLAMDKGQILLQKGDTLAALTNFSNAIKADSTQSYAWSARATLELQMHNNAAALQDLNHAIELKSTYAGDYINRGLLNYWNKNYRGAFADYDKAVELDNQSLVAHFNRGLLRSEVGDLNNAILDFNKVIELDPQNYDAYYQRALLETETGNLAQAIKDYTKIIERYPDFPPAYYGRAHVKQMLHDAKGAYLDQMTAQNLEKEKPKEATRKYVNTGAKMEQASKTIKTKASIFDDVLARTGKAAEETSSQPTSIRGAIQNVTVDIVNEPNFEISFYNKDKQIKRLNYFYEGLDLFNHSDGITAPLKITNAEIPLTSDMAQTHFTNIKQLSNKIAADSTNATDYFLRGINYAILQNYPNALNDFSKAIQLNPNFMLAYFCRANTLYKSLEVEMNNASNSNNPANKELAMRVFKHNIDQILNDYNKAIELAPNFAFAYFNEGNLFSQEKDMNAAIDAYSKAIQYEPDFAEAYYNRGLAYLYQNDVQKAVTDLSKAGELGIYQSYNVMKRISDNTGNQ